MPHILLRFMAIDDKNKVKVSRRIASICGHCHGRCHSDRYYRQCADCKRHSCTAGNGVCIGDHRSGNGYRTQQAQRGRRSSPGIFAGILACTMSTSDSQPLAHRPVCRRIC
ncbi:MAG: hypothetical protein ACLUOF_00145 [Ruminococcus sp.]